VLVSGLQRGSSGHGLSMCYAQMRSQ
jgi:hypothetical protein